MVGTRGKGSKSKSEGPALVPDKAVPLNSEVVPALGGRCEEEQMMDGEEGIGFQINDLAADGKKAVLTNLDKEEKLEDVSGGGDAVSNVDVKSSTKRTNEEETQEDEDVPAGVEEKGPDLSACVTNAVEGLAASEYVLVENLTENMVNNKEANELTAEEPVSTPVNGGDKSIKENASSANEVIAVAGQVVRPKKKIIRKKLIKKKISLGKAVTAVNEGKLQPSDENVGSDVLCKADTTTEVKPQCLKDDDATGESSKEGKIENLKNEETVEGKRIVKVNKKVIRIRKKNSQGQPGVQTGSVEQKPNPEPTNEEPASKENQIIEQEFKNEEAVKSKARLRRLKKKNIKVVDENTQSLNAKDIDKPESSKNGKLSKKIDSMGMIFMCNSETKKDCFKYNVLGLPDDNKDIVSKIYKGMRLFLFDVGLKMLYGIYKAAGPGSYNLEPRAFKSQYPAQVRFTLLDDCLPLPEEKFKKVIKDNYYTKKKFDFKLTNEQVKNLCKLFRETTKKSKSKRGGQTQRAVPTPATQVDRKRKWAEDTRRVGPGPTSSLGRERRIKVPEQVRHAPVVRAQEDMRRAVVVRGHKELRLAPAQAVEERYRHPVVVYEREAYRPLVASSSLYQPTLRAEDPPRTRIYSYQRDPGVDTYRRDSAIQYRDLGISAPRESGRLAEQSLLDPYGTYREARAYRGPASVTDTRLDHRGPAYEIDTRLDHRGPAYETGTRLDHRGPAYETGTRLDPYSYSTTTEGRYAEYYRSDEYRPPLPPHRRY